MMTRYLFILSILFCASHSLLAQDTIPVSQPLDSIQTDTLGSNINPVDTLVNDNLPETEDMKTEKAEQPRFDRLVMVTGDTLVLDIIQITPKEVRFHYPYNYLVNSYTKEKIHAVLHKHGQIEMFSPMVTEKQDEITWEDIVFIYSTDSLAGLTELDKVEARYDADKLNRDAEFLHKNVMVILAKKALNAGGKYVFIEDKYVHKAYGELPYMEMSGIIYKD